MPRSPDQATRARKLANACAIVGESVSGGYLDVLSCCVGMPCMRSRMLRAVQQTAVALTASAMRAPSLQSARRCHAMLHSSQSCCDRTATSPTRLRAGPCRPTGLPPKAFGAAAGTGDTDGRMWTASNGLRARERFGTLCSVASWHAEQHAAWHVAWHAAYDSMPRGTEDWKPQPLEGPSACGVVPGRCGARSCAQAVLLTVGRSRLGPFPLTVGRVPLC